MKTLGNGEFVASVDLREGFFMLLSSEFFGRRKPLFL
jgi:hypothetical protein